MSGQATWSPHLPIDWHTPTSAFCELLIALANKELHLAPGRCETARFSPNPPCFCCLYLFSRQRQLSECESYCLFTTHTVCDTALNSTPFTQTHSHILTLQPSPCPLLPQYKSDFSREHSGLHSSVTDRVQSIYRAARSPADQSSMGSSISCVPQHNFRFSSKSFIRRNR